MEIGTSAAKLKKKKKSKFNHTHFLVLRADPVHLTT